MSKKTKSIFWAVLIIGIIVILVFNEQLGIELGAVFAFIAGGFASLKSKLFKSSINAEELTADAEEEHALKRQEWSLLKEEFNSKYNAMRARMDYLDYKSALIAQEIKTLDDVEKKAIENNHNLSEEEILRRLRDF